MGKQIRAIISRRVRELRVERGLSVNELARAANVSPSYIYAIESGVRGSRVEELCRVARVLGVGIETLVGEVDYSSQMTSIATDGR